MAWIEPRVDWDKDSRFDMRDYNRIKNNLKHLREMAVEVYLSFDLEDMGEDKIYADYIYADMINLIEDNLELLNKHTYQKDIGETKKYYPNQYFINFEELNRIERLSLDMYAKLINQIDGRRNLTFNLGKRGGL